MSQPPPYGPPPGQQPQGPSPYGQPPQGPPPGYPPQGPPPEGYPPQGPPPGGYQPQGPPPEGYPPQGPPPEGYPPQGPPPEGYPPQGQPYGMPPHGAPHPGPPPRSGFPWVLLVSIGGGLVILIVIAAVVLVALSSDGGSGVSEETVADRGGDANPDMAPMGEAVTRAPLEFVVSGIDTNVSIPGHTPTGEHVVVYVDVYNDSGSSDDFWSDEQVLYMLDGSSHHFDRSAHNSYSPTDVLEYVEPGQTLFAEIVFDIPNSDELSHIGLSRETTGGDEVFVDMSL